MPYYPNSIKEGPEGYLALFYRVHALEGFLESAQHLFHMLRDAQRRFPDRKRYLFLDIDEHRNGRGDYDADMVELQSKFLVEFLMPYLTEAHGPIAILKNPHPQDNTVPAALTIFDQLPGEA